MVMLLIAGIVQIICGVVVIAWVVVTVNKTNDDSYCDDRYVDCTTDSSGIKCADWYGADAMCSKQCVGDDYCPSGHEAEGTECAAPPPPPR
jgi:hypothetical protein